MAHSSGSYESCSRGSGSDSAEAEGPTTVVELGTTAEVAAAVELGTMTEVELACTE